MANLSLTKERYFNFAEQLFNFYQKFQNVKLIPKNKPSMEMDIKRSGLKITKENEEELLKPKDHPHFQLKWSIYY